MRVFRRSELKKKTPNGGWTAALELEISKDAIEQYLMFKNTTYDTINLNGIEERNDLF